MPDDSTVNVLEKVRDNVGLIEKKHAYLEQAGRESLKIMQNEVIKIHPHHFILGMTIPNLLIEMYFHCLGYHQYIDGNQDSESTSQLTKW